MTEFSYTFQCGHTVQCEYIKPDTTKTQRFTVVYAHGFCSDPYGRKPEEVKKWCLSKGMGFFRYEIAGHGSDKARFEETTINTYKSQIFEVIERLVDGPIVAAGTSLGGWLALLVACHFPERVIGMVGLAAAPDFLKTYIESYFQPKHLEILNQTGKIEFPTNDFTYIITKEMIASGRDNLMLDKDVIPFSGKVRLLQGMKDASLEWHTPFVIAEKLQSTDVIVHLLKSSNHRLSTDEDIKELFRALDDFLV